MLFLVRGLIIAAAKRISLRSSRNEERARDKVYFAASVLLLLLNISLILPVSLMVVQRKPVSLTLTPAIVMAAYTTYKVTMAAVNLRKRRKSSDCLVWLLRTVNFMDALVSILTLQNTLIMVCSNGRNLNMLPLSAPVSAVVWVTVLILSVTAIKKGSRRIWGGA